MWVSSLDVSASLVKLDSVGALRLVMTVALGVNVTSELPLVRKLSVSAGEEVRASMVHLLGKSKLLAVEDEGSLVCVNIVLSASAKVLGSCDGLRNCIVLFFESGQISVDIILVCTNSAALILNSLINAYDVVVDVADRGLEGLESDQNFSLHLDSLFVVVLIPNCLLLIEVVNLLVEVSTWKNLAILLSVIRCLVVVSNGEAWLSLESMLTSLSCEVGSIGNKGCSNKCDGKFHNFYF